MERYHFIELASRRDGSHVLESRGIPTGRPTMLYVGRLLALKQPDDAIRAMAHAIERHPQAIGVLAGTGPMQDELERLIAELGMEGRIFLAGHVDQEEISLILPHCITVSPLTGMALIEAGLAGSPIAAYDRDWQAEFVSDGENGFLVPFRDHRALGEAAAELIANPQKARLFSERIRQRAMDLASPEKLRQLEAEIFDRLLGRSGAAAPQPEAAR
jgi:glycosyltransferase involved in cell wall biosynthesis